MRDGLREAQIEDADFNAVALFEDFFTLTKREIFNNDFEVPKDDEQKLRKLFERRKSGEPLQYILGYWTFYSRKYYVGQGVLIPRDDTEVVLRAVFPHLNSLAEPNILDLCSGSGILAITLKCEFPKSHVTAVEISHKALSYLEKNANLNNAHIEIIGESLFDCYEQFENSSLDLIISNPPYIKTSELKALQSEVLQEPMLALDGGEDGCFFLRGILFHYAEKIKVGGMLAFELDSDEAEYIGKLMEKAGFDQIKIYDDLGGIHRAITGIKAK